MISTKIKSLIDIDKKTVGLAHLNPDNELKTENLSTQLSQHYNFRNIDLSSTDYLGLDVLLVSGAVDTLDSLSRTNLETYLSMGNSVLMTQSGIISDIQAQQASIVPSDVFEFLDQYGLQLRSVERRVGKECRSRWSP